MKKVLVIGYLDLDKYKKLAETYKDVLFIEESNIWHYGCNALIELVGMFDEVKNIQIAEMSAYPVAEEKGR